jgi:glycosyltransferase involved in cell wall biosynthesis
MPFPLGQRAALRRARHFAPDVVHVQSPFVAGSIGRRLARVSGARLVFTHHTRFGDYTHYLGPLGRAVRWGLGRRLARFWADCDAVIAPADDLAAEIRAGLPAGARTLVRTIPTGFDVALVRGLSPLDPRGPAGWEPDAVVAAVLGRLAPEKSVDVVIDAVEVASHSVPGLRLAIIGDGPARATLEARAAVRLGGRAWFAGARPRTDALRLLRGADLFAFASRTETQGLVLAEALACGLPVVSLEGPGVRGTVRHGTDGIVVERDDRSPASSLGAALATIARDRSRRASLAEAARTGAIRFDVAVRIGETEGLYRELLLAP